MINFVWIFRAKAGLCGKAELGNTVIELLGRRVAVLSLGTAGLRLGDLLSCCHFSGYGSP